MEDERRKMAEEKARKKAEEAERIRKENAEMKARIKAANKGRDSKELDAEIKKKQKELKEQRQAAKDAEAKRIKDENRAQRERIKNTQARAPPSRPPALANAAHPRADAGGSGAGHGVVHARRAPGGAAELRRVAAGGLDGV